MRAVLLDRADDGLLTVLNKKTNAPARILLAAVACLIFFTVACGMRYAQIESHYGGDPTSRIRFTAGIFTLIFALALAIQLRIGRGLPLWTLILTAVITGCVLLAKISLLDYESDDFQIFLTRWMYLYQGLGVREGLGRYVESDYTPPYLYLLQIASHAEYYPWNYLVKFWSVLFEVLLCAAVTGIAGLHVRSAASRLLVLHLASMLPTVVFNSAYWGQCDVIYVSFCLLALYLGLRGKGSFSMISFGVALSFKLQTVFFLPVLLPFWLRKDVKLWQVLLIPTAYMGMMIPALWGGKSLHHVLTVYIQQAGHYNFITVNGTSLWHLIVTPAQTTGALMKIFGTMATMMGFAAMAAICVAVILRRDRLTDENVTLACLLTISAIPYFLPKMHERYTFGADVLSVAVAAHNPRLAVLPLLFGLSSYICYTAGLPGDAIFELKWASLIQGAAVLVTAIALWRGLNQAPALTEVKG
ncbi:MAG: hypothetical protein K5746_00240 [Clostridiales bacterium]|nr:hypothetical protein [Clostridiales bacterium]